jgi:hypothetical protein
MAERVRALGGFARKSDVQLITMADAIIAGLTDNPAFPSLPVALKAVQASRDDFSAAVEARPHGGRSATADKNNKRAALIVLLRKLKHYVEDACEDDAAALLSSGFRAAGSTRYRAPLDNPAITGIVFGKKSGELVLKVTPIARARVYYVRSAVVQDGNVPGPWQDAGLHTDSRAITVTGLTPGTTYCFQVQAVGGATGCSAWSDPVSRMSA